MTTAGTVTMVLDCLTALNDAARLRIMRLLQTHELSVGELSRVLQLPQSTVSRHLRLLIEASLIARRSDGTAGLHRVADTMPPQAERLWTALRSDPDSLPGGEEDDGRVAAVLAERRRDSRGFFGEVGEGWERLRAELFGTTFTAEAILSLLDSSLVIADLGCGIGNASLLVAPRVREVIAVDRERAMLEAVSMHHAVPDNLTLLEGDILDLPLGDASVDVAMFFLVLHHVAEPQLAITEAARIVRNGGRMLIVDMREHLRDDYRHTMGHLHLGFSEDTVTEWARQSGCEVERFHAIMPDAGGSGPTLFAAVLRKT